MTEEISKESLSKSEQRVGQLYPVIVNKEGKVLDGNHRVEENPSWHKKVVETKSRAEEILVRIHAHHRRQIPQEETKAMLLELAEELEKSGIAREKVAGELYKAVPYSESYVSRLLPEMYKQPEKVEAGKVSAELVQQKREQPMMVQCSRCPLGTYYPKDWNGQPVCPSCYDLLSQGTITLKEPKASVEKPPVEVHKYKPIEKWEHRKATMQPQVSRMEEELLESLHSREIHVEAQKEYCIKKVIPDFVYGNTVFFVDGEDVHAKREERDEDNRQRLANIYGVKVVSLTYKAYSKSEKERLISEILRVVEHGQ